MKKIQVLSVTSLLAIVSLTGCGKKSEGEKVDTSKAQLTIGNFDGGVGEEWLKNAIKVFEQKNAERTDFEEGKVGVQIRVTTDRSGIGGGDLETSDLKYDIFFTENVDYYMLTNQNKLADITDILTTANSEDGGKKIIDKIDGNLKNYMNRDGKYYAVPFYDCFYGLVYDKDLFEQKSFYMKDDGSFTNQKSQFGTGPNGVAGDWDDGLPKTYEQFDAMLSKMVTLGVIPFTYSSTYSGYTYRALTSWWSDNEGVEDTNLNYSFNGKAHHIVTSINNFVPTVEEVDITQENGYLLRKQAGLYNALHFARDILCDTSSNYQTFNTNFDVQTAFVNNKYIGKSVKPIAMMFEGPWWENEATDAFDMAESSYAAESFNYGYMPIPKSSEDKIGDATIMNLNNSYGFISASSQNMKLAKEFFSFLHTDEQLRAFTAETSMTRGLNYTFTENEKEKVSSYANDLISMKESEHVNIVYPYSGLEFVINNGNIFSSEHWQWSTSQYTESPITKFVDNKTLTAEAYFNDHASMITPEAWSRVIR